MPYRSISQFDRHPDPTSAARAQRSVHHRDPGEAVFDGRESQRRIGGGSGATGDDGCGHLGINSRECFQVALGVAGWNAIDALKR